MARARVPAPATLVAFLATAVVAMAATATGAGADNSTTICATAKCGKGTCSEVPGLIPGSGIYQCTCDPGWSQLKLNNVTVFPSMPCIIPSCSFSSACFNLTMPLPRGIPLTNPCDVVDCGQGGACQPGAGFDYQCRCQPGFNNLLNDTAMPCIGGNCTSGADCAKLGLVNTTAAPAPAPVGNCDLY